MIEKYTRFAKNVESLSEAWQFVMQYVDEFEAPSISISPVWEYHGKDAEEDMTVVSFEVSVSGSTEEEDG